MKTVSKRNWLSRTIAGFLVVLLTITAIPSSVLMVGAETAEHSGVVTLTVVDGEQMAVSDADVSYTISVEQEEEGETEATEATEAEETEETEGEVGNSVIAYGSEKTDSYGTVEVLSSARYQEGLVITAQTVEEN